VGKYSIMCYDSGTCIQHNGDKYHRTESILLGVRTNSHSWDQVGSGNFLSVGSSEWRHNGRDTSEINFY
jgi:hypothetical protein